MPNSAGVTHRRAVRAEQDAPAVARLRAAGAIPLGVTNVSELTMWIESDNRVYGRANNAYDQSRTAGGSSGGEGAIVGAGGSPFGLGSDIGGSIRLPAFFNGVFGHKPSAGFVPNTGQWPDDDGDAGVMLALGPLARRAEDLMPVLRLIAGPDGIDARTREVALGDPEDVEVTGLDVALASHSTRLPFGRDVLEARDRAAAALEERGARVRLEPLRGLRRALGLYLEALGDGGGTESVATMLAASGAPPLTLVRAWRARRTDHTLATLLLLLAERAREHLPGRPRGRLHGAIESVRREVEDVLGAGVLLHPTHGRLAPRHHGTTGRPWVLTPTAAFNLTGLPATTIPLGLSPGGLPTGVQAIAGRDRDHVSIAVALRLEEACGGWTPPPRR